ncbi:carbon-nitrogen hydrolase [Pelagibaculum spongiae]|uniref:Acyltransferase n=1 Tax=Pelagibaculum spongiae TaxID=2080658 RepID=A0A2V1GVB3_9GAMM|nr:carbon-nitrogen hydrolase [Pelagibaculum spongiae]PVZ68883.1 acyltransferase [Pelagibaculum spongiae]
MNKKLKVALVQAQIPDNTEQSKHLLEQTIRQAAAQNVKLILLPELHNGAYFCQQQALNEFDRAESIPGPTTDWLSALAKQLNIVIVGSVFERRTAGIYHNTGVVLDSDGSLAGIYRKMHIPDDPGFNEKFYFTPGDIGFKPINTSVGRLGLLVCWDQWYPEAARLMALAGAEILLYPTAIGWDPADDQAEKDRQLDAWQTVQRGHAVANGLPVLSCNRTGFEASPEGALNHTGGIDFWGGSFITGPQGEFLAKAEVQPELLIAELDLAHSENVRRIWPFFRDRRIDEYGDLTKRFID